MFIGMDKQEFQQIVDSVDERRRDVLAGALSLVMSTHAFQEHRYHNTVDWQHPGGDELEARLLFTDALVIVRGRAMCHRDCRHTPQNKVRFTIESAPLKPHMSFTVQKVSLVADRATPVKLAGKIVDMRHIAASEWARVTNADASFNLMERRLDDLKTRAPLGVEVTRSNESFNVRVTGILYDDALALLRRLS